MKENPYMGWPSVLTEFSFVNTDRELQIAGETLHLDEKKSGKNTIYGQFFG